MEILTSWKGVIVMESFLVYSYIIFFCLSLTFACLFMCLSGLLVHISCQVCLIYVIS